MRGRTISVVVFTTALAGCGDQQHIAPLRDTTSIAVIVTDDVRNALDPSGRFPVDSVGPASTITPNRAIDLARVWKDRFAPYVLPALEDERGEKIDLRSLKAVRRPYLALSPYATASEAPKPLRTAYSDYFIVQFADQTGMPVISVAVSAIADHIAIVNDRLALPTVYGNEFSAQGISERQEGLPMSPETAARLVYAKSGSRISGIPRLVQEAVTEVGVRAPPQRSLWRVTLEKSIQAVEQRTGQFRVTNELFVGRGDGLFIGDAITVPPGSRSLQSTRPLSSSIRLQEGAPPERFTRVTILRSNP